MQSPGWQSTLCVAKICKLRKEWSYMTLIPSGMIQYVNPYMTTQTPEEDSNDHMQLPIGVG